MKRYWFGLILMVLLLVCGLLATLYMGRCHSAAAGLLEEAGAQASAGNWQQGIARANLAKGQWDSSWHISAVFADHEPMEEIDSLFAQLALYAEKKEKLSFCALCAQLSSLLEAIGDAHSLTWWNLL